MTQDQFRYQQLQEEARHNLELEGIARGELGVKQEQAQIASRQADIQQILADLKKRETVLKEKQESRNWFKDLVSPIVEGMWLGGYDRAIKGVSAALFE